MGLLPALALLVVAALADDGVMVLTAQNWDEVMGDKKYELIVVEFYAPWCGHCKQLAPEYSKAAKSLAAEGKAILLAKVDATVEKDLASKYQIRGFPTLLMFRGPEDKEPYEGPRDAAGIVSFLSRQVGSAVTPLATEDDFNEFKAAKDVSVVAFAAEGSPFVEVFSGFASKNRNEFRFGLVTDPKLFVARVGKVPTVMLFKPFDEELAQLVAEGDGGSITAEELQAFVTDNKTPIFGEITQSNYQSYLSRGLPLLWVFVDPGADTHDATLKEVTAGVTSSKKGVSAVWLSGVQYGQMAEKMGLSPSKLPGLAIEDADHLHFVYNGELVSKDIEAWLKEYTDGKLTPTIRSQPIPEPPKGEDGLYVAVADNFKQLVMDDSKDVLIEFYAPWCGHCKHLAPVLAEVAETYADDTNIVIAKMDATANDVPVKGFNVEGFPTMYFIPAGSNGAMQTIESARTQEAIEEFINTHRTSEPSSKEAKKKSKAAGKPTKQKTKKAAPQEADDEL
eukprot:NODE_179_length_1911_cov_784.242750_g134_i0.p1 GENE.NODE_179_length_1911_cov_784.242750_g134_i0~~NODE_179_length_1911_cov_784.242750_g134_i0.p1  ORF type:complete len:507 (+),score=183.80 NODE_179_length_1911_cov_784.242750_g134_i0:69-1589(+)